MCDEIVKLALDCGADHAAILPIDKVILDVMFRDICQSNACGNYGLCYMCPPDAGDIRVMIKAVHTYSNAMIYQTIRRLEDSFDYEGMLEAGTQHAAISQKLEGGLHTIKLLRYLHLSVGGCKVCDVCAKRESLPCRYPDLAMPSLESYGVDVYRTAQNAGLGYNNGQNSVTYFGMVLLAEV